MYNVETFGGRVESSRWKRSLDDLVNCNEFQRSLCGKGANSSDDLQGQNELFDLNISVYMFIVMAKYQHMVY